MGDACGGHHVQSARADRGGGDHDLAPALRLCEPDRSQCHRLLVLAAPCGKDVLRGLQGLGQAGDVAVTENGEHARKQRNLAAVDDGELIAQIAHKRLRHSQTNGLRHRFLPGEFPLCRLLRNSH